jgi:tetratricopeptide (TPR) repeat protein
MLGEILLDQSKPADALKEFEASLKLQPNRFWSLYGAARAAKSAGNRDTARQFYGRLLAIAPHADRPERQALIEARRAARTD